MEMNDDVKALMAFVLKIAKSNRCQWDMDRDTWERGDDACDEVGDHEVEGPHDMKCGYYCKAHAERTKAEHCEPPHRFVVNERWQVDGLAAATRAAKRLTAKDSTP